MDNKGATILMIINLLVQVFLGFKRHEINNAHANMGTRQHKCYPNGTCDGDLKCTDMICINEKF